MQLVDGKWSRELNTEFKFQLLSNENRYLSVLMDSKEIWKLIEWEKMIVIGTLVFQNCNATALATRRFAPENINYVYLTKSVKVVNIHTKAKIIKFKLHQNGSI